MVTEEKIDAEKQAVAQGMGAGSSKVASPPSFRTDTMTQKMSPAHEATVKIKPFILE